MENVRYLIDLFLHLDKTINTVIHQYGTWTYGILFLIIFCETGLVVTPILPGDSLLFAAGALSVGGELQPALLIGLLGLAAIIGDTLNYAIGMWIGDRAFSDKAARFFKPEYLERTHRFYERYGAKMIVLARFVPIIRTFAPFVAGMGRMTYGRFLFYNITGGIFWVSTCVIAGYFFGNLEIVKKNFTLVILMIIFISILPALIEVWRERRSAPPVEPAAT